MSDQPSSPPKPKVSSLRDRIAAFEKPGGNAAPPPGPATAPRPKPGGLQWKPKVPSPPSSPSAVDSGPSVERKTGGMSASDAKESIGKGGSLKERMAALQGRGGFGAPPPVAPKPPLEKPKWKPPPVVAAPPPDEDEEGETHASTEVETADVAAPSVKSPESESVKSMSEEVELSKEEGEEPGEADPEEEERQRRAAIAARMARLGGARVGMAPVYGAKPVNKKVETPKEEIANEEETAKPIEGASAEGPIDGKSRLFVLT